MSSMRPLVHEPITAWSMRISVSSTHLDCGRRVGYEDITPIPGCSLGMAITLGRECGKSVGAYLG